MLGLALLAVTALNTGDDLLAACTGQPAERLACSAMVLGVANGAMMAGNDAHQKLLCVLPGVRPADLIEAVRKYLDAHPERRSKPAGIVTYQALREILPCPKE
jgi:hypothetical protein